MTTYLENVFAQKQNIATFDWNAEEKQRLVIDY